MDLAQTVFQIHAIYHTLINNFGNLNAAIDLVWSEQTFPFFAFLIYAAVEVAYIFPMPQLFRSCY